MRWHATSTAPSARHLPRCDWTLAREAPGQGHFNGRIEAVRIYAAAMDPVIVRGDLDAAPLTGADLVGAWDFSRGIETQTVVDVSGHARHGVLHQMPTRAVKGVHWRGDVSDWRADASQDGAIQFHEDDLIDAGWRPSFTWRVPIELPSGVYAVKLTLGDSEDYTPFFVRAPDVFSKKL